jgi:hypothetical protein
LSGLDDHVNAYVRSGEEQYLPILELPADVGEPSSQRVCFLIFWRKTSSSWLPQLPVTIMTSTDDIKSIVAALVAQREDDRMARSRAI